MYNWHSPPSSRVNGCSVGIIIYLFIYLFVLVHPSFRKSLQRFFLTNLIIHVRLCYNITHSPHDALHRTSTCMYIYTLCTCIYMYTHHIIQRIWHVVCMQSHDLISYTRSTSLKKGFTSRPLTLPAGIRTYSHHMTFSGGHLTFSISNPKNTPCDRAFQLYMY